MTKDEVDILVGAYGYVQITVPETEDAYNNGHGEELLAAPLTTKDLEVLQRKGYKERCEVVIAKSSMTYTALIYGTKVVLETRDRHLPIVTWDFLQNQI